MEGKHGQKKPAVKTKDKLNCFVIIGFGMKTAVTVTGPKKPEVSHQPGGPISINLGSHQDKPVKSIEVTCKVEFT